VQVQDRIDPEQVPELVALLAATWWSPGRSEDVIRRMLSGSDVVLAALDEAGRLVGFARVLTDRVCIALVLDVVVAEDRRGTGVGAALMDAVVAHPDIAAVESLELVCQPELRDFYRRWGFTDEVGRSGLMRRTAVPGLLGR
jgi:GNAT superfamily N-acetyltransferase